MAGQGFARWLHAFDAAVASDFRLVGCPVVLTAHKHTLGCDAAHLSHRMFTFHDAVRVSQRRTHTHTFAGGPNAMGLRRDVDVEVQLDWEGCNFSESDTSYSTQLHATPCRSAPCRVDSPCSALYTPDPTGNF